MTSIRSLVIAIPLVGLLLSDASFGQSAISRGSSSYDSKGQLEPHKVTEVATAEMGIVREMTVKPGTAVQVGDVLGKLDSDVQLAALREAEADAASVGALETARSEVEFNSRRVRDRQRMVEAGHGAPAELERYQMELNIAMSKLKAQEEAKAISLARLKKAQLAFSERTVYAPHDGIVVEVYHKVGEYIAGNSPAMVRLIDTSRLRATFLLSEHIADRFRDRTKVEIRLPNNTVVEGNIEFISPFASAEGQTIPMTVLVDNADLSIRSSTCELVLP